MPIEPTYPGVYIEEIPSSVKPIPGVDTSIAAFAGWTASGRTDGAELVSSWTDFESKFGGLDQRSLLGYSVQHFFENGGGKAYVVRIAGPNGAVLVPNTPEFETALLPASETGGLYHLDNIDLFNLLCVPGETNAAIITSLQKFCRDRRAFMIVDCPEAAAFADMKAGPGNITGDDAINSALYFPWVLAPDKLQNNSPREFPPCGFVAGIYSRVDVKSGVWKAPAGVEAMLLGVAGVAPNKKLTNDQNAVLNPKAINCIRTFPREGTIAWGVRTLRGRDDLASDWKYVPVRRTFLFIEQSIYKGMQWVVFEPNGEPLWAKIRLNVGAFMHDLFRKGAFQGRTQKEGYFVKCDRETTTQNDINNGVVNILVGFAPLKPAEFVIIRIHLMTAPKNDT